MRKIFVAILLAVFAALPLAADIVYPDGFKPGETKEPFYIKKVARGFNNVWTSPIEIPKAMFDHSDQFGSQAFENISMGLFVRGPFNMFQRLRSGLIDLATFGDEDRPAQHLHLEPEYLDAFDALPGYPNMFMWKSIDTPAYSVDNPPVR